MFKVGDFVRFHNDSLRYGKYVGKIVAIKILNNAFLPKEEVICKVESELCGVDWINARYLKRI